VRDRVEIFSDYLNAVSLLNVLYECREKLKFLLLAFVIMPEHFHGLIIPSKRDTISDVVRHIKGKFARRYNQMWQKESGDLIGDWWEFQRKNNRQGDEDRQRIKSVAYPIDGRAGTLSLPYDRQRIKSVAYPIDDTLPYEWQRIKSVAYRLGNENGRSGNLFLTESTDNLTESTDNLIESTQKYFPIPCQKSGKLYYKVWQDGFYDYIPRDLSEVRQKIKYIIYNPVKTGLVDKPDEYRFSSAHLLNEHDLHIFMGRCIYGEG
jgi:REP element-mobilizing transposase RayT